MRDSRVVWLGGPRQAGKITLAKLVAQDGMPYVSLDVGRWRNLALSQPEEFLQRFDSAIIDEIQVAPDLVNAIKIEVDSDQRRGRFLLTGSANILAIPRVSESLAGRMLLLRLMPLSQAEIRGGSGNFLSTVFAGGVPETDDIVTGPDFVKLVLAGGFPEALAREASAGRQEWFDSYVETIVLRDMPDIDEVGQPLEMLEFVRVLALFSGKTVNFSKIGEALPMSQAKAKKYMRQLEYIYLVQRLPSWRSNKLKRFSAAPKLFFLDSGLLANLLNQSPEIIASDRTVFGALAETFVYSELLKQTTWNNGRWRFSHMRSGDGKEVDLVVENGAGRVVGIEVKAGANVSSSDFSGLRVLEEASGDSFVRGIILSNGRVTKSFGDKFMVLPISSLWS